VSRGAAFAVSGSDVVDMANRNGVIRGTSCQVMSDRACAGLLGEGADHGRRLAADWKAAWLALAEWLMSAEPRRLQPQGLGTPICGAFDSGVFFIGNSKSTSPSQNAIEAERTSYNPGRPCS